MIVANRRTCVPGAAAAAALLCGALLAGCSVPSAKAEAAIDQPDPLHTTPAKLPPAELGLPPNPMAEVKSNGEVYPVPPPPLSDDYFPCSGCHSDPESVNKTRRPLTDEHTQIVLHHDEQNRWCLDCHDAADRDKLHLASGATIPFEESYRLCGQCHGTQFRDWKVGIHGKRTGMWNGKKEYLLCVHCHNPHSPHFKPLKPEPPPVRPENIR